jgi:hypothetical protein
LLLGVVGDTPMRDRDAYDQLIAVNRVRLLCTDRGREEVEPWPAPPQPASNKKAGFELGNPELTDA